MNIELARTTFLSSVDWLCAIDETSVSSEFVDALNGGGLRLIISDLVCDLRLQTNSLRGETFVFVPQNVPQHPDGIWNLMVDAIAYTRELSGCRLYEFNNLKLKLE